MVLSYAINGDGGRDARLYFYVNWESEVLFFGYAMGDGTEKAGEKMCRRVRIVLIGVQQRF